MKSMLIIFLVVVSTAYCSVVPLGLGLAGPVPGGVILGGPVVSSASVIAGPIAAPLAAPGVISGAVLAGPSGTVATKNGAGLGLIGGIGLGHGLL